MQFYFQKSFIKEVKKLLKKTSYKDCEEAIIKDIFIVSSDEVFENCSSTRLNASKENPIAKLRISGKEKGKSSSYRLYLLALKVKEKMYFAYIHPKTGVYGKESLSSKERKNIIKKLIEEIKKDEGLSEVSLNEAKDKIVYVDSKKPVFK